MLGNLGEMAKLLSRVKDIQKGMKDFRDELPGMVFTGKSPDGSVSATLSGDFTLRSLDIAPGTDSVAVECAVIEAVNAAGAQAKEYLRNRMKELSGGIGLDFPGLM